VKRCVARIRLSTEKTLKHRVSHCTSADFSDLQVVAARAELVGMDGEEDEHPDERGDNVGSLHRAPSTSLPSLGPEAMKTYGDKYEQKLKRASLSAKNTVLERKKHTYVSSVEVQEEVKRVVGQVEFTEHNKLPFDINPLALITDVGKRIRLPRAEGCRLYKSVLKSPGSCQLLTYYFWHYYCKRYLPREILQKTFLDLLAERFVTLFWGLKNSASKDYFLEYYPYAIAEAVCSAFDANFQGSTEDFDDEFRNTVFRETRMLFNGVDSTLDSMQMRREQMALIDYSNVKIEADSEDDYEKSRDAPAIGVWDPEEMKEALRNMPGYTERREQTVQRQTFDAKSASPLVRHYVSVLSSSSGTAGRRPLKVKWTLPPKDLYASQSNMRNKQAMNDPFS